MHAFLTILCLMVIVVATLADEATVGVNGGSSSWISSLKGMGKWFVSFDAFHRVLDRIFSFVKSTSTDKKSSEAVPSTGSKSNSDSTDVTRFEVYDEQTQKLIAERVAAVQEIIKDGDYEKALDKLIDILAEYKDDQVTNALTGALLLSYQQYDMAEDVLYHAVRLSNWTDVNAAVNLGTTLRLRGDSDLALKVTTKAYVIGTNSTDPTGVLSLQLGDLYYNTSQYIKAREWYLSAAIKMNNSDDVWLKASTLLFPDEHKDLKIAENVLLEGVSRNRNSSELIFYLGYVMYSTDRSDAAITFFQQAVRLNNKNLEALSALAIAFHTKKDYNTAFQYYNAYVKINSKNAPVLANFAVLLSDMNRIADAEQVLSLAYDLDANDPIVLRIMKQLGAVPSTSTSPSN